VGCVTLEDAMSKIRKPAHGPEWYIQQDLIEYLQARSWHVERLVGNAFQTGIPDLYVFHRKWGERWIDVKQPKHYSFTKAQKRKWPEWERAGIGIWILTAATQEEYDKLFGPPNWRQYWKPSWGDLPDVDALLDELVREHLAAKE
jgi:hypothetical protein